MVSLTFKTPRMNIQSPPTLLELAGRSLLSDKSRAVLELEDLPIELFPPLFPQPEMLRVALDGLDMLLAQQDRPSSPEEQERLLSQLTSQFRRMTCLRKLCMDAVLLLEGHLEQVLGHLKTPLETLSITNCPLSDSDWNYLSRCPITRQLRQLDLRYIKLTNFSPEPLKILLETVAATLNRRWKLQVLDLRNVHHNFWRMWSGAMVDACSPEDMKKNHMRKHGPVRVPAHSSPEEQERLLSQLTSQFLRMDCLRKFCVDAVLLLEGHLEQAPKTPLEALSITNCPLSDSNWNYLSRCPNTSQLRRLDLRGIKLTNFSPEPFQIILETVAATLRSLDLEACEITDSQLQAILPALSHCSQLRILCFLGNRISMSVLRDLLLHTARI
ncbi:PRAME family member 11-like [Urocitellus parryii]